MICELKRLLTAHDDWLPRVGGHFLRADLPWLIDLGIDGITDSYAPSSELKYARIDGGWDTSLMAHACKEDIGRTKAKTFIDDDDEDETEDEVVKEGYGLKSLAVHLLGMKPWEPVYATKTGDDWKKLCDDLRSERDWPVEYQKADWNKAREDHAQVKALPLYLKADAPAPSTDKKVLQKLHEDVLAANGAGGYVAFGLQLLRDVCKLGSILRTILSSIEVDLDDEGNLREKLNGGHYQHLREDGKIHSNLRALTVTGRLSSSAPNMQNIGKGAEELLKRLAGVEEALAYVRDKLGLNDWGFQERDVKSDKGAVVAFKIANALKEHYTVTDDGSGKWTP